MNRQSAKKTLLKYFIDNYSLSYPVAYSNNKNFLKDPTGSWIRFRIMNNYSSQRSYGETNNRKFNRSGIIAYEVFLQPNTGTYEGDTICEYINTMYEGKRFGDIVCTEGIYEEIGINEQGLFQFNGTIYFNFDEKK